MFRHPHSLVVPWDMQGHPVTTGPHRHLWWPIALLARIIHECRREAFETEVRRGPSQVMADGGVRAVRRGGRTRKASPGERIGRRSRYS